MQRLAEDLFGELAEYAAQADTCILLEPAETNVTRFILTLREVMQWVDRINGIDGLKVDVAMMREPDGEGRVELTAFRHPPLVAVEPAAPPPNAPGLRSLMFSVDDLDATVARLAEHGGTLIGEAVQYEDKYRLCYVRGPAGIIVALAQPLKVARTGPPRPAPGRRSHVH